MGLGEPVYHVSIRVHAVCRKELAIKIAITGSYWKRRPPIRAPTPFKWCWILTRARKAYYKAYPVANMRPVKSQGLSSIKVKTTQIAKRVLRQLRLRNTKSRISIRMSLRLPGFFFKMRAAQFMGARCKLRNPPPNRMINSP